MKNVQRKAGSRFVSWGKYTGRVMRNVPTEYLEWFIKNGYHQMVDRKKWAREELNRRNNLISK